MKIRYVLPFVNAVLLALLLYMNSAPREVQSAEDANGLVTHVYVIRRPLDGLPIGSAGPLAHSALLLRTANAHYVLEYMDDSRAHLTRGTPTEVSRDAGRKIANIKMNGVAGGRTVSFEWERQLRGSTVDGRWTPQQLQQQMQALMKPYSLWKAEHCHQAQQRLRAWMQQ